MPRLLISPFEILINQVVVGSTPTRLTIKLRGLGKKPSPLLLFWLNMQPICSVHRYHSLSGLIAQL